MQFKWNIPFIKYDDQDRVNWIYWTMRVEDDEGNLLEYTQGRREVGLLPDDAFQFHTPASVATEEELVAFIQNEELFDTTQKEFMESSYANSLSLEPDLLFKYYD